MSNIRDVAMRLVQEHLDGTAQKDLEQWAREAAVTLQRILDMPAPAAQTLPGAAVIARAERWLDPGHLRLHAGEMTVQEMRTTQAVIRGLIADLRQAVASGQRG